MTRIANTSGAAKKFVHMSTVMDDEIQRERPSHGRELSARVVAEATELERQRGDGVARAARFRSLWGWLR